MAQTLSISLIAAVSRNGVIGNRGTLPWHLPADLAHFKKLTLGKAVLMGRGTWLSIGRPLPGRDNLVLTRNDRLELPPSVRRYGDRDEVLADPWVQSRRELMVIGGAQIYHLFFPLADTLYLTWVDGVFAGDTRFPEFNRDDWVEVGREDHPADEKNPWPYRFLHYRHLGLSAAL